MKKDGLHYGIVIVIMAFVVMSGLFQSCRHDPFMPDMIIPIDTMDMDTMNMDTMDMDTMNMDTSGMPCDTDLIYFVTDVLPILNSNCALSGCHDEQSASDGVILTSYERLLSTTKVTPFDLQDTEIFEVITETDEDKQMPPPPRNRLTADQIQVISKWILQGAENLMCDETSTCDTSMVSYMSHVVPIFENNCNGCHSTAAQSGGVILDTYNGVQTVASNGRLVGAISHEAGFSAMPQNQPKLPECDILTITAWVNQGALNN